MCTCETFVMDKLWLAKKSNNYLVSDGAQNHTPPGDTVIAHVSVEVPQQNNKVPGWSILQAYGGTGSNPSPENWFQSPSSKADYM